MVIFNVVIDKVIFPVISSVVILLFVFRISSTVDSGFKLVDVVVLMAVGYCEEDTIALGLVDGILVDIDESVVDVLVVYAKNLYVKYSVMYQLIQTTFHRVCSYLWKM